MNANTLSARMAALCLGGAAITAAAALSLDAPQPAGRGREASPTPFAAGGTPLATAVAQAPSDAATALAAHPDGPAAPSSTPTMQFPDGSSMPALNGVRESTTIAWPADVPFARVVEKVTAQGQEWYRHEDGSWTTVVEVTDRASGRRMVMPQVWSAGPLAATTMRTAR